MIQSNFTNSFPARGPVARRGVGRWPPALGRVAAGYPLEAIEDRQRDEIACLLGGAGRYALRVGDDSMHNCGIFRGDIVIVQSVQRARSGDIVAALVDDEPLALHRLGRIEHHIIRLLGEQPGNPGRELAPARVSIEGKVVGQLRYYA